MADDPAVDAADEATPREVTRRILDVDGVIGFACVLLERDGTVTSFSALPIGLPENLKDQFYAEGAKALAEKKSGDSRGLIQRSGLPVKKEDLQ